MSALRYRARRRVARRHRPNLPAFIADAPCHCQTTDDGHYYPGCTRHDPDQKAPHA